MNDARKLSPSAGAEWLLGGFALLRKSPLGLGLLGAIFGAIATVVVLVGEAIPNLVVPLQIFNALLSPLLLAGLIWAAREVDQSRPAQPAHLVRGAQEGGVGRLLATLLPQLVAMVVVLMLLALMVGTQELQAMWKLVEDAQKQMQPSPEALRTLPFGRLMLWVLLALVVGIVAAFFTFTALPQIVFEKLPAWAAMRRSFHGCVRNLGALLVFLLLLLIAAVGISILVQMVAVLFNFIAGQRAMLFVAQVLMMAVLMPVVTGAMYMAWKQMYAEPNAVDSALIARNGEIEV